MRDGLGAAVEQQVRAGRFDPGQVVEGVVLAGKREAFRLMHALHDGDGVVADLFEDLRVTGLEFVGRKVGLVVLRGQLAGQRQEHNSKR